MRNTKLYKDAEKSGATPEQLDEIFEPVKLYNTVEHTCTSSEQAELKRCTSKLTGSIRNFGEKSAQELLVKIAILLAEAEQKKQG